MPLTKQQIIEVQEAAKYNFKRRVREQEEEKEHKEAVRQKLAENTAKSEKKGK